MHGRGRFRSKECLQQGDTAPGISATCCPKLRVGTCVWPTKKRFCDDLAKDIVLESMEQANGQSELTSAGELTLRRSIGLWQMTLYAAGSMLGAGIYGLIGQVAGEMGSAIWLAFLLSLVAAGLTGLSYASLGSRYPRAGGAAYIT